jgi:hypothetical protein
VGLTFDEVWKFLGGLTGRRFHTLDQRRPFTLEEVGSSGLAVRVEATGFLRTIPRAHFEEAWHRLSESGRLSRTEIHREISLFNPAYVAALLAQVPGIQHRVSPIVLIVGEAALVEEGAKGTAEPAGTEGDEEVPGAEEIEESMADRLVECGRRLGFEVQKEWRTDIGNRIDVVWARPVPRGFPGFAEGALLPVVGFEIETSWRTRKHVKGDIFNLQDLGPSLGVIILCKGPNDSPAEIAGLQAAARRYIGKLGLRIQAWTDADLEQFLARQGSS